MTARYGHRAQPMLDSLAQAAFADRALRDWLVAGTRAGAAYKGSASLHAAQAALRPATRQPFYCNYFCGRDAQCRCRPPGSRGLETDLMLFLQDQGGRVLAVHVEYKHPGERLSSGQAAAYPMRAACWCSGEYRPRTVMAHDDWLTIILCDPDRHPAEELAWFDKVIPHAAMTQHVPGWPA